MTTKLPVPPDAQATGTPYADRAFAVNLMEHLVVATFVLDAQCKVLIWNHACERLTGVVASDVIGTSEHWRAFYSEPRPCLADLIALQRTGEIDALYSEHADYDQAQYGLYAENWCVMPQVGTRLYLGMDAGPIYDEDGRLIAVVETLRDLTQQKEAQLALEELVTRDGLTGMANRRTFDQTIHTEWRRAIREARTLSLLMIDVDHFKHYNDTYGHQQGDECLKLVAHTMAAEIQRASDLVARYGGEEFAVILPGISIHGAAVVAERIRAAIEKLQLPHAGTRARHVTASIGAATALATLISTPADLISIADAALYRAKKAGRNRIALEASEPHED